MTEGWTRSSEKARGSEGPDWLAEVLTRVLDAPRAAPPSFKPPCFNGEGDVEFFYSILPMWQRPIRGAVVQQYCT